MGDTFAGLVTDGPLLLAAAVAALVGLISFASPCVLPLVPGYLSYVTGLAGSGGAAAETGAGGGGGGTTTVTAAPVTATRRRMVLGAALFTAGFTAVFVAVGAAFGQLGRILLVHADTITRVMGVVTVVIGLAFLGRVAVLQRTVRMPFRPAAGLAGAPLLGVVFGLGWTPCIGPTLGAVLQLAYTEATAGRGAFLALAYCVGLGVPFVLVALGARWALASTRWLRRHTRAVSTTGGVLLVVIGVLLLTGMWTDMMIWFRSWVGSTGFGESFL